VRVVEDNEKNKEPGSGRGERRIEEDHYGQIYIVVLGRTKTREL